MSGKVLNDNIHGLIRLHPLLVKIIDQPAFQRLRNISQLGAVSWVYPSGNHHRFEHSIGTAYLAGKLVRHIRMCQPELELTDTDVLIAELAGLLHDLGHGPFSHTWDGKFLPLSLNQNVSHEELGLKIFDFMLKEKGGKLRLAFEEHGVDSNGIQVVKEMIMGGEYGGNEAVHKDTPKEFLYEVISNKRTGLDVDKLDYLARDTHALGISLVSMTCDIERMFTFTRVCKWEKQYRLAFRDKELATLLNFFHLRQRLHRVAYQHKTSVAVELMLVDALLLAEEERHFAKKIFDVAEYVRLTDHIFWDILFSTEPRLRDSRTLLEAIVSRKLYRSLVRITLNEPPPSESKIGTACLDELQHVKSARLRASCNEAIRIVVCFFSFSSTPQLHHQLLVYNKEGTLTKLSADRLQGAGDLLTREPEKTSPNQWEVRLYSTHSGQVDGLEGLKELYSIPGETSVNNALAWAFCRWCSTLPGKADVQTFE